MLIKCTECKEVSDRKDWREDTAEVGCEDCGSHMAFVCPKCDEYFDAVFNDIEDMAVTAANE